MYVFNKKRVHQDNEKVANASESRLHIYAKKVVAAEVKSLRVLEDFLLHAH